MLSQESVAAGAFAQRRVHGPIAALMDAADYRNVTDHRGKRGRVFCLFCYNIYIMIRQIRHIMVATAAYSVICVYQIYMYIYIPDYVMFLQLSIRW